MADWKVPELGNKTLLQYANTPEMDRLARLGRTGMLKTVPDGFHPGSEVANSSILGYDQHKVYEGRGPLEAASIGVELAPDDLAMRCNLICIEDGKIKNHSCGRLETSEGDVLIKFLQEKLGNDRIHFYTGVQYRHLLVIKGGNKHLDCTPPHDVPGKEFRPLMIKAQIPEAEETAALLNRLILESQELLKNHPLNKQRMAEGKDPANSIWPWAGGNKPKMEKLTDTFPEIHTGAVITAVDLIRGIGTYAKRIVGPIARAVESFDQPVSIAVLPDHPTPCKLRTHTNEPIPFLIYHKGIEPDNVTAFDEYSCRNGAFGLLEGRGFIDTFMKY